jgi:hypothetical protein
MKTSTNVARLSSFLLTISSALLPLGFAMGCAPTGFSASPESGPDTRAKSIDPIAKQCVPDTTDYVWDVNIFGFGISGVDFGASYEGTVGGPFTRIGVGLKVNKGTLDLEMDSLGRGDKRALPVSGTATKTSGFNFTLDLGIVKANLGTSSDAQTAMLKLTQAAFDNLLKNTGSILTDSQNPWSTRVTDVVDESHIRIPVGTIAGIQSGDQFNVYRYHDTSGANGGCSDDGYTDDTPIATYKPATSGLHGDSTILVPVGDVSGKVSLNDVVVIAKLDTSKSKRSALKKSVRIILHQPNAIVVTAGTAAAPIDLTSYLRFQMGPSLNKTSYWVVP